MALVSEIESIKSVPVGDTSTVFVNVIVYDDQDKEASIISRANYQFDLKGFEAGAKDQAAKDAYFDGLLTQAIQGKKEQQEKVTVLAKTYVGRTMAGADVPADVIEVKR